MERAWAKRGPLGPSGPGPPKCQSRPNAVYVLDERNDKFLFFQSSKICSEAGCCARLRHIPGPPVCVRDVDPLSEAGGARVPAGGRRPAPCCCARYAVGLIGNYRLIGNHRWGAGAIDNRECGKRSRPSQPVTERNRSSPFEHLVGDGLVRRHTPRDGKRTRTPSTWNVIGHGQQRAANSTPQAFILSA